MKGLQEPARAFPKLIKINDGEYNAAVGDLDNAFNEDVRIIRLRAVKACKPGQMGNQAAISSKLLGVCSILSLLK